MEHSFCDLIERCAVWGVPRKPDGYYNMGSVFDIQMLKGIVCGAVIFCLAFFIITLLHHPELRIPLSVFAGSSAGILTFVLMIAPFGD